MPSDIHAREAGQSLAWVALMLVVLLGFVGLAIDGGIIYAERRRMQNAADAGALAGAWEICFGTAANAQSRGTAYAVQNGSAAGLTATTVSGGRVDVVTGTESQTSFVRLLGIDSVTVPAHAAARCGKATQSCGLWPVTFDRGQWLANKVCGRKFLLWHDGKDGVDCTKNNCDVDNDGVDEVPAMDGRAWADFTAIMVGGTNDPCDSNGCSDAELKYRLVGSTNKGEACRSMVRLNTCMVGDPGVRTSAWKKIEEVVGEIRTIPLYSSTGCAIPTGTSGDCGPNETYFITDFACIQVEEICQLKEAGTPNDCDKSKQGPKVIIVSVPCDATGGSPKECATECGVAGDEEPLPGDAKAVSLIE